MCRDYLSMLEIMGNCKGRGELSCKQISVPSKKISSPICDVYLAN